MTKKEQELLYVASRLSERCGIPPQGQPDESYYSSNGVAVY